MVRFICCVFCFKQKTAYELRMSDWSSDVCSSDLLIVWQHDGRTKAGKEERAEHAEVLDTEAAVAVTMAQRDQILGMADALRAHPLVAKILDVSTAEEIGRASCRESVCQYV